MLSDGFQNVIGSPIERPSRLRTRCDACFPGVRKRSTVAATWTTGLTNRWQQSIGVTRWPVTSYSRGDRQFAVGRRDDRKVEGEATRGIRLRRQTSGHCFTLKILVRLGFQITPEDNDSRYLTSIMSLMYFRRSKVEKSAVTVVKMLSVRFVVRRPFIFYYRLFVPWK